MSNSSGSSSEDSVQLVGGGGRGCGTSTEPQEEEPPPPDGICNPGTPEEQLIPCELSHIAPPAVSTPCVFIGQLRPQEEPDDPETPLTASIEGQLRFEIGEVMSYDSTEPTEPPISSEIDSTPFQDVSSMIPTSPVLAEPPPRLVEYIGDQFHNKNPHTRRTILLNPRRTSDNDPVVLYRFYQFCCPCSGKVWFSPLHRAKDGCFCRDCHHFLRPFGHVDGLTPYMGHELCYAKFECHVCRRNWSCQKSKSNFPDNCFNCGTIVYPYYQVSHSVLHRKIKKSSHATNRPPSNEELDEMLFDEEEDAYNSFQSSFAAAHSIGTGVPTTSHVQNPPMTKVEKHLLAKFSRARTTRKKSSPHKPWKGSRSLKRNTDETQLARRLQFAKDEVAKPNLTTTTPPTTSSSSSTEVKSSVRKNSSSSGGSGSSLFFTGATKILTSRESCTQKDSSACGKVIDRSISEPVMSTTTRVPLDQPPPL